MTWTYTNAPSSSARDAVRFLSGDNDTANQGVTDEEIAFLLTEWNDNTYLAAAAVCDAMAGTATTNAVTSKSVGDLSLSLDYSGQAAALTARAAALRAQSTRRYPPTPSYYTTDDGDVFGAAQFSIGMDANQ